MINSQRTLPPQIFRSCDDRLVIPLIAWIFLMISYSQTTSHGFAVSNIVMMSNTAIRLTSGLFSRTVLYLLLMVFVPSIVPSAAAADSAIDDYNVAVALFKQSRWNQAADQFRKFLKNHDKHEKAGMARLYLGLTLVETQDYRSARDELRRFAADNRQNVNLNEARYRIGECSYFLNDFAAARPELESFLRDFPDDPLNEYALPYLGDTQLRLNDATAALQTFDRAIEKFRTGRLLEDARFGRARALDALKRFDESTPLLQEIAANKDGHRAADAQFQLAASNFERDKFPEATQAYLDLIVNFPKSPLIPSAHLNAGFALYRSGQFQNAVEQFELAGKDKSQQPMAGYWQGRSLKSLGEYASAIQALRGASQFASRHPLAESILFEQGLCERYSQHPADARKLFDQLLLDFPAGDLADDSLHALIEMSIEAGDLPSAELYLAKFREAYAYSGLRLHVEMLAGRLDLARAALKLREKRPAEEIRTDYDSATRRFEKVMDESTIARTKGLARYYLALTKQLQGDQVQALELIAPLVEKALADGEKSDFADAIVLQADSLYQQQKYELTLEATTKYLDLFPKGRQTARALSLRALSADQNGNLEVVAPTLARLEQEFPTHPLTPITFQQLADLAESRNDWVTSRRLFETTLKFENDPEKKGYALRGIALSQFEQGAFADAAASFGRVVTEFPQHKLVMECQYFQAESLKRADQPEQAMKLFAEIFETCPADRPAADRSELNPPLEFCYKAGLQVARLLNKQDKVVEADTAYAELLRRFPHPADLDKRLDEWAIFNYRHERFERSDAIWRRLVEETPDSPLVNSARLSLAESDLFAGKYEEARQAFEELAESDKSTDEIKEQALFQQVVLAVDRLRWTDVRLIGNKLIASFPNSSHRYYVAYSQAESLLAGTKSTEQELVLAREKLQFLQQESNNDAVSQAEWFDRVWVLLAEVNFREAKYDQVEKVVEELKHRKPDSRFLYLADEVLGRSYKQQAPARFEEARAAFERVLADPAAARTETAAKAQFLIGDTYFLEEKWDEASLAYQKVYSNFRFPEWQAAALLSSGKCDESQNAWKLAAESYKLLIQEFPKTVVEDEARRRLEIATKRAAE